MIQLNSVFGFLCCIMYFYFHLYDWLEIPPARSIIHCELLIEISEPTQSCLKYYGNSCI